MSFSNSPRQTARILSSGQDGFTMIIAIGVMFVTSLLLVAAFTAANGDIHLSHEDSTQKQAYYASLAGVQEYEYKMQANPDYWETCGKPSNTVQNEPGERYEITPLVASTAPVVIKECLTTKPFESMIESSGSVANTFRIESTGYAGTNKHTIVATFKVTGFLNYVYYTNFETEDPGLYEGAKECEVYRKEREVFDKSHSSEECQEIRFFGEGENRDDVKGPMHTNDSADICGTPIFGRAEHVPADVIEMNRGTYSLGGCSNSPTFNTATKSYVKGAELIPPSSDTSLGQYVESEDEFTGVTHLTLNGAANTITVKNAGLSGGTATIPWPKNGLIWVKASSSEGCEYSYDPLNSDESKEESQEPNCGTVYVNGTYKEALTIGSSNDLIINGNIYPTSVAGKLGSAPTGTATLGLIANNYVRVYHPTEEVSKKCVNEAGSLYNPWIYAAILSTNHSFVVDNYNCGASLEKLNVYGAIAQDFRGIVGTGGGGSNTGYIKNYNYDERLAVDEPPYFLSPLNAGWKVARETAPTPG
jgi:hypothetical protein